MSSTPIPALVVGTGFGCRIHVPALRAAGFEIAGLVGTNPERLERRAAQNEVPATFTDLDEAISKTGAKLVANETGLVVDHCAHPWDALAVDAIWFIRVTGANDANSFFVERMLVRIDDRTILLDALMLDGGRRLVDAAYASMRERIRAALRVGRN